jgi:hypothetical protein
LAEATTVLVRQLRSTVHPWHAESEQHHAHGRSAARHLQVPNGNGRAANRESPSNRREERVPVDARSHHGSHVCQSVATVSQSDVYWFDDTGRGEVRVPRAWRLLYKDGNDWKPVAVEGAYQTARDRFNSVRFAPVTTTGLRLEVTMQPEWSAGVREWTVK